MVRRGLPVALKASKSFLPPPKRSKAPRVGEAIRGFRRTAVFDARTKPFRELYETPAEFAFDLFGERFVVHGDERSGYVISSYRSGGMLYTAIFDKHEAITQARAMLLDEIGPENIKSIIDRLIQRTEER